MVNVGYFLVGIKMHHEPTGVECADVCPGLVGHPIVWRAKNGVNILMCHSRLYLGGSRCRNHRTEAMPETEEHERYARGEDHHSFQ